MVVAEPVETTLTVLAMMDLLPWVLISFAILVFVFLPTCVALPPHLLTITAVPLLELVTTVWLISLARLALRILIALVMVVSNPTNLSAMSLLELVLTVLPTAIAWALELLLTAIVMVSAEIAETILPLKLVVPKMVLLAPLHQTPTAILFLVFALTSVPRMQIVLIPATLSATSREVAVLSA